MAAKKNNKRKTPIWKTSGFYFEGIFALLILGFVVQLMILKVLPMLYFIPLILVLILILVGTYFLLFGKRISKVNKILGHILVFVLCICLGIGNFYIFTTNNMLSKITNDKNVDGIQVLVLKDSSAEKIDDLKGKEFGIGPSDAANVSETVNEIEGEIGTISSQSYQQNTDLAKALYDKEVDAIILNSAYVALIEDDEQFKNFSTETKVVYTHEIEKETANVLKDVNVTKEPFNVYVTGIDTYGPIGTNSRSDVNMIMTVNPLTKKILLTSIPRDYYIPQVCQANQKDKLTHTGIFGVDCTTTSVENYFGIDINYYVRVNFSSVVNIVDALGGITVNNPVPFTASDGSYSYEAGDIYMDGAKALRFARERYNLGGGDSDRGMNQTRVITGIINKAISPAIITNYTSIMNSVSDTFQTNMPVSDITAFIQMQLSDMSGWDIQSQNVTGTGQTLYSPANGFNSYQMVPNDDSVVAAVAKMNQVMNEK